MLKIVCLTSLALTATGCQSVSQPPPVGCPPPGYDKAALLALKANGFDIADSQQRQSFALALEPCLGSADPQLRDGVAYEALAKLLRGSLLAPDTVRQLRISLLHSLQKSQTDVAGVRRPFAALALSEVARADRMKPVFTDQEREEILAAAIHYMDAIDDYRGYDETEGWRHGVAHTADLYLQLLLNPALTTPQLERIANSIAAKVAPPGEHFYVYGEYERLARPIALLATRDRLSDEFWARWFAQLASPAPFASWGDTWNSQAGLARMHNTKTFAATLYLFATASESEGLEPVAEGALTLLRALN